jgi:hypothetical protein
MGAYNNDCFFRCIAYIYSNGTSYSEAAAASYAYDFFANQYGYSGINYLSATNNAGMTISQIQSYIASAVSSGSYTGSSSVGYIGMVSVSSVRGAYHAFVVKGKNPDGSVWGIDPSDGSFVVVSEKSVTRVMF